MSTYKTKFNMGDRVWIVSHHSFQRIVRCKPCGNTGKIVIAGEELICPKCSGRSTHAQYAGEKHYVAEFDTVVGKITVEHEQSRWRDGPPIQVKYMVEATGVGSGTVWDEERLFASLEDAQHHCDQKNGLMLKDECADGQPIIDAYDRLIST